MSPAKTPKHPPSVWHEISLQQYLPRMSTQMAKRFYELASQPLKKRVGYGHFKPHRFRKILYTLAALVILAALLVVGLIKYFHVEERLQQRVIAELQSRGIALTMRNVSFDLLGGVVAQDVSIFQTRENKVTALQVSRVRFTMNWLSWWRGQPLLGDATVYGAQLNFPVTSDSSVTLEKVNARVKLRPGQLLIDYAEANLSKLHLRLDGEILMDQEMPLSSKPPSEEELQKNMRIYEQVRAELERLSTPLEVYVKFKTSSHDPLGGSGRIHVETSDYTWQGVRLKHFLLSASYEDRLLRLERASLGLGSGGVNIQGLVNLAQRKASFNFWSDADPTQLDVLLDEKLRDQLASVEFHKAPKIEGIAEMQWEGAFTFFTRAEFDWQDMLINNQPVDRFHALVSYDGTRFMATDVLFHEPLGELKAEMLFDGDRNLSGKVSSTFDFTKLRPLFGAGAQPFLTSLWFEKGPSIDATFSGHIPLPQEVPAGRSPLDALLVQGKIVMGKAYYKNGRGTITDIHELKTSFTWQNRVLKLPDLFFRRAPEEQAKADVVYDFNVRHVFVKNGGGHVNIQKTVPIFGGKLETYTLPYRIKGLADVKVSGKIDLATEKETELNLDIQAPEGMDYDFLKKTLRFTQVDTHLDFKGKKMTLIDREGTKLFGGQLLGTLQLDLGQEGPPYIADFKLQGNELQDILTTYFGKQDAHGITSGTVHLTGRLNDVKSIEGGGELQIKDGDLYQIPVLGGLSQVIGSILPVGYSRAEKGSTKYSFKDGVLILKDLSLSSATFALIGDGTYNFVEDELDMRVRVNVRGPLGVLLFPVSKAFEYRGTGPLSQPKWEANVF